MKTHPKEIQSLAEKQTVKIYMPREKITRRIQVRVREYEPNKFTNDILIDGKPHVLAVGDCLLNRYLDVWAERLF